MKDIWDRQIEGEVAEKILALLEPHLMVDHSEVRISFNTELANLMDVSSRILTWLATGNPVQNTLACIYREMKDECEEAARKNPGVNAYQHVQFNYLQDLMYIIDDYPSGFAPRICSRAIRTCTSFMVSLSRDADPKDMMEHARGMDKLMMGKVKPSLEDKKVEKAILDLKILAGNPVDVTDGIPTAEKEEWE